MFFIFLDRRLTIESQWVGVEFDLDMVVSYMIYIDIYSGIYRILTSFRFILEDNVT